MAAEVKLPELGENVDSGTVTGILVSKGNSIEKDQPIIELETDKAVVEVPSDQSGTVQEILVNEGDEIKVGQKILVLGEGKETGAEQDKSEEAEKEKEKEKEEVEAAAAEKKEADKPEKKEAEEESAKEKKAGKEEKKEPEKKKKKPAAGGKGGVRTFNLPELGENVESGTVTGILVSKGDKIEKDQNVIELETEKAVVEIPVDVSGVVEKIYIEEGDEIKIGQKIMDVSTGAEAAEEEAAEEEPEKTEEKEKAEEKTDKEAAESEPEEKEREKKEVREEKRPDRQEYPAGIQTREGEPAPAAPSVRRFAREIGIDINHVPGTGPSGRISVEDVKNYSKTLNARREAGGGLIRGVEAEKLPDFSKWGEVERKPMSKVREKTATHLSYAWATIPHVTQFDKADITEMEKLRKQYGKQVESEGAKLTMTVILLKIIAAAMQKFPQFNASIDMENHEIIYKKYVNIGIAVDTDRGLLVPVVRNVDRKNLTQLAVEVTELAGKARDKKLSLEEMQGGNFSISNLGGIGGTGFAPVVNSPDVAILGVSRAEMQPVFRDGDFVPRLMLPLSVSYDHRLIDGADAARFLRWVCEAVEQPFKLMLEG